MQIYFCNKIDLMRKAENTYRNFIYTFSQHIFLKHIAMHIAATIKNSVHKNDITVETNSNKKQLFIPGKLEGRGSSVNGGELLFLALATCCCNDIYREAAKREIIVDTVTVSVTGEFGKEGEPATNISYSVQVKAPKHTHEEIAGLVDYVDKIAEVHNTLRQGIAVKLITR